MDAYTKNLVEEVHQRTGYPVVVEVAGGLSDHARMVSARPASPVHLIEVNEHYRAQADYIVAAQCSMLLVTWSDPSCVWGITTRREKADHRIEKWSKAKPLKTLDAAKLSEIAELYLRGILNQLFSLPLEISVFSRIFAEADSLREAQSTLQEAYLRRLSSIIAPTFKSSLPEDVFRANVGMNAAMAIGWSRLTGQRAPLIPYESVGALEVGGQLLKFAEDINEHRTAESHKAIVDAWAVVLSLRSLYEWESSDRRS
jgi:hypothetical protein